ncbi:MAG: DUF2950 domain-containing protein [Planctomycetota bacterium]|nr:DUF2950 domain-containing protein [Planctomycetota bacterium]
MKSLLLLALAAAAVFCAIFVPDMLRGEMDNNEAAVVAACKELVAAQRRYYEQDRDGDGRRAYAKVLYGPQALCDPKASADARFLDEDLARADASLPGAAPYRGYFFRVLYMQGAHARDGMKDYRTYDTFGGALTVGFAAIAYPAKHKETGRQTFLINQFGTIHKCDLGGDTERTARGMQVYDPGPGWAQHE